MEKLIINAALTGMVPTKADNPHVPISPNEIAADAFRCYQAGASILHLHARDQNGQPTYDPEVYREIILKVRHRCPDAIICASTSGRNHKLFEQRSAVLELEGDAKPDMGSLTLGSLNFPKQASVNDPKMIQSLARKMQERGIVPELEVFSLGMVDYAKYLIKKGFLQPPYYFNILLGSLGTLSATPFNLATVAQALPDGATWAATGIGRFQFYVNSMALTMGGNIRVGLEDNIYLDTAKTTLATNLQLIKRMTGLAQHLGRPVATAAEARQRLGMLQSNLV